MSDLDVAVRERLDDLIRLLDDAGHGRRSRADLTRALIFAAPADDVDHLALVVRYGAMRLFDDVGYPNGDRIIEAERDLGWWAETTDRADVVTELQRIRNELKWMRHDAVGVLRHIDKLLAPEDVLDELLAEEATS